MQTLFGGWSTVTPEQFDGRCRCTGYRTYNPDQRVVCACTGPPGGDNDDLWRKGPYKILSGCVFRPRLNSLAAHDFPILDTNLVLNPGNLYRTDSRHDWYLMGFIACSLYPMVFQCMN